MASGLVLDVDGQRCTIGNFQIADVFGRAGFFGFDHVVGKEFDELFASIQWQHAGDVLIWAHDDDRAVAADFPITEDIAAVARSEDLVDIDQTVWNLDRLERIRNIVWFDFGVVLLVDDLGIEDRIGITIGSGVF